MHRSGCWPPPRPGCSVPRNPRARLASHRGRPPQPAKGVTGALRSAARLTASRRLGSARPATPARWGRQPGIIVGMAAQRAIEGVDQTLAAFARTCRSAGLPVDARPGRALRPCRRRRRGRRAGRGLLGRAGHADHRSRAHRDVYDRVFEAWFAAEPPGRPAAGAPARRDPCGPDRCRGRGGGGRSSSEAVVRARASAAGAAAAPRRRQPDPGRGSQLARLFSVLRPVSPPAGLSPPPPLPSGDLDLRGTLRDQLRTGGEPGRSVPAPGPAPAGSCCCSTSGAR